MHFSSMWNMRICLATYAAERCARGEKLRVLDVGSMDVNGSYRQLFAGLDVEYVGADMVAGAGVEVVLTAPYELPFEDGSFDLVLCGQMLEHCEFPWLSVREMIRVLSPEGLLFLIAPSAGPIHRYPVDCYRYYPDAYRAFAKDSGSYLVDVWMDDKGPWRDLAGVFARSPRAARPHKSRLPWLASTEAGRRPAKRGTNEQEATRGEVSYLDVLQTVQRTLAPPLYLELGVRHGDSLALAVGRAIGVDPFPDVRKSLSSNTTVISSTSEDFFVEDPSALGNGVDLAFIDGLHLAEYVFRDFVSVERHSHPWTLVVIDDVLPCHPDQARRERCTNVWTGDVWRTIECLRTERPDLLIVPVDSKPTGLALIAGLNRNDSVLTDKYNSLHKHLRRGSAEPPPRRILRRRRTLHPYGPAVASLLALLARLRRDTATVLEVRQALLLWRRETRAAANNAKSSEADA